MCIYILVTHPYVFVCVCVCECVCVCLYVNVCIHTHTNTHTHTRTRDRARTHTKIVTYLCRVDRQRLAFHVTVKSNLLDEFTHAVVHTHAHAHAHTHKHTFRRVLLIFLHISWMSLHTRFRTAWSCCVSAYSRTSETHALVEAAGQADLLRASY